MRWRGQQLGVADESALPGLERMDGLVRSVTTPEFAGITFHEVLAKSALNHVPGASSMPFNWTINPYRGCSHACSYCLDPDTLIVLADGRQRRLGDLRVGDHIVGTERSGNYRRYVETTVRAKWSTHKRAYRITLADGTQIIASGDHRFLSDRGWKHVTGTMSGSEQRPFLTTNNRLQGFGLGGAMHPDLLLDADFRRGYLAGMIRGDGMIFRGTYVDAKRTREVNRFRLALADAEALDRTRAFLLAEGIETLLRPFTPATTTRRQMTAIHTARRDAVAHVEDLIRDPVDPSSGWRAGFLSGVFDAEGSCSRGVLRISNSDPNIIRTIMESLAHYALSAVVEPARANGVRYVRLLGGLPARQRFFQLTRPAITRKLAILGTAVKTASDLRVVGVEGLGYDIDMVDITTGTGDFIANGVISHNCFARGTHEYLDLDAGADFDSQIIVKTNVADVLRRELRAGSWQHEHVALGTNTDPYQRAEGRYALMPSIIEALAESGTPLSILTKGTLIRRDLGVLAAAREHVPVDLAFSIAVFDDALQHSIEPGTPTATARLEAVRAATVAGFGVTVFMMPVMPHLTDSIPALDDALARIKEAGAVRVVYGALHLRPGVKPWFMQWLEREHPELVSSYRGLYPGATSNAPKGYRQWLAKRVRPLIRAHRLDGRAEEEQTMRARGPGPVITTRSAGASLAGVTATGGPAWAPRRDTKPSGPRFDVSPPTLF
ncbi:intein-containing Rv2578c family radical SAM protein [Microbacterium lacus]|uniref:intein-containing Rv2578c family radical SAM protein n=1 Tax=Microbacterium lacus TaxID=415217 RepID=UPI0012FD3787|nr:intein-containing Rv2578c family radical SAM protein [Microbacterium lacus]